MPTVRSICTDALVEIGVLSVGETMDASLGALSLRRAQQMIESWQADRLTLAIQRRTTFTLASGTSTVTLGPTGDVVMVRPVWLDIVNYVVPGTSPAVEAPVAIMGRDQYALNQIKSLQSSLPTQCFYQTSLDTANGSLYFWPQVTQDVTIALYCPEGIGVPATLDSILTGPQGYSDAFMYNLAVRLLTPTGQSPTDYPLLIGPEGHAAKAMKTIARANTMPGVLGVDPALSPLCGGGYNVLTDNSVSPSSR